MRIQFIDIKTVVLTLLILLLVTTLVQGVVVASSNDWKMAAKRRLHLLNKPLTRSFTTKYGDILDCVEINKQLAFDHPLLKNHSIQMKPNLNISISKGKTWKMLKASKGMKCPKGTVPITRIQLQHLAMDQNFSSFLEITFSANYSANSSFNPNDAGSGHQTAFMVAEVNSLGVSGTISAWSPQVTPDQYSEAHVYVASDDGSVTNGIVAGWTVYPYLYKDNLTRLFTYWSKDSGKTTGCYNSVCPGFIQVSQKIALGVVIQPVSTYGGQQYYISTTITQDVKSRNWWLLFDGEEVGYWPKELFSSLTTYGSSRAGWGGEIYSPPQQTTPAMGSGHFPEEGFSKACVIYGLNLIGLEKFPTDSHLKLLTSNSNCYKVVYGGDAGSYFGHYMFFGGPPNCKL